MKHKLKKKKGEKRFNSELLYTTINISSQTLLKLLFLSLHSDAKGGPLMGKELTNTSESHC